MTKHKLLIVDDIPLNIKVLARALRNDYDILIATNGMDALKIAESEKPHVILLDVMMPVMDGYEVCKRLTANESTKRIPVIFTTTLSDEKDRSAGITAGAVDYITKPIDMDLARRLIRSHLNKTG